MADKQGKQFRTAFRGYDRKDVAAFIEEFNTSYLRMEEYYRGLLAEKSAQLDAAQTENAILKKKTVQAVMEKEKAEAAAAQAMTAAPQSGDAPEEAPAEHPEIEKEVAVLRAEADALKAELSTAREEAEAAKAELAAAKCGEEQTHAEEEDKTAALTALQAQLQQSEEEKEALKKELATLQESFDGVVDAAKVSLDESGALLATQNEKLASLERELQEAKLEAKTSAETSEEILENARKEADEIIKKAKNTAQLIQISALRKKEPPQTR